MSDTTCRPDWNQIEVGPVDTVNGTSYMYKACGYLSVNTYANAQSALHDARKPQRFSARADMAGRIEPVPGL